MGIRFADSARGSSWLTLRYKDLTSKIRAVVCGTCTPVHWYTHCEIDRHGKRGRAKGCFRVFRSGAASQFSVFHGHCCSPCRLYDLKYIWQNGSALLKGGKQRILARQVTTNVGYQHLSYPRAQNRGQYIRTIGSLNGDSAACLQLLHRRRRQRTGSRSAACMLPACLRGGRDAQAAPCGGVSARLAGSSGLPSATRTDCAGRRAGSRTSRYCAGPRGARPVWRDIEPRAVREGSEPRLCAVPREASAGRSMTKSSAREASPEWAHATPNAWRAKRAASVTAAAGGILEGAFSPNEGHERVSVSAEHSGCSAKKRVHFSVAQTNPRARVARVLRESRPSLQPRIQAKRKKNAACSCSLQNSIRPEASLTFKAILARRQHAVRPIKIAL